MCQKIDPKIVFPLVRVGEELQNRQFERKTATQKQ